MAGLHQTVVNLSLPCIILHLRQAARLVSVNKFTSLHTEESVEEGYAPSSAFLTATQGFDQEIGTLPSGARLIHTACLKSHRGVGSLPLQPQWQYQSPRRKRLELLNYCKAG